MFYRLNLLVLSVLLGTSLSACKFSDPAKAKAQAQQLSEEAGKLKESSSSSSSSGSGSGSGSGKKPSSGAAESPASPASAAVPTPTPSPSPSPVVVAPPPKPAGPAPGLVLYIKDNGTREFFSEGEVNSRTLKFDLWGEIVDCSRNGGLTWGPCNAGNTLIWNLADYDKVHVVRAQSYGHEPVRIQFTPSVLYPKYRVLTCDVVVQQSMSFQKFQLLLATPGKSRARPRGICIANNVRIENEGLDSWITFPADHVYVRGLGTNVVFHSKRLMQNFVGWSLGQEKAHHPLYGILNVDSRKGIAIQSIKITSDSHFGVGIHGNEKTDLYLHSVSIETKGEMAYPIFVQGSSVSAMDRAKIDIRSSQMLAHGYASGGIFEKSDLTILSSSFKTTHQGDALDLKECTYKITYSQFQEAGGNTVTIYSDKSKGVIEDSVIYDGSGAGAISLARGSEMTLNRSRLIRVAQGTPEYYWYNAGYGVIASYDGTNSVNQLNSTVNGNLICMQNPTYKFRGIVGPGVTGNFDPTKQLNGVSGKVGLCL